MNESMILMSYLSSGMFFVLKLVNVVFVENIGVEDVPNSMLVIVGDAS